MSDYAGSYKLKKVSIIKNKSKSDISDLVREINIWSYVNQPSTTVMITMKDAVNFLNDLPIKGGQEIEIEVGFDNEIRIWKVVVVSVEDINGVTNQIVYNLRCVSHLLFKSHFTTISQSFSGKVSDIAKSIFEQFKHEDEKIREWEESVNSSVYIIPGWSPAQTLLWLASKSKAKDTNTNFKFFQDSFLNFNFLSLESLNKKYLDKNIQSFHYGIFKTDNLNRKRSEVNEIIKYSFNNSSNILESFESGFLTGRITKFNMTSKNLNEVNFNYFNEFKNFKESTSNKRALWNKEDLSSTYLNEKFGNGLELDHISRFRDGNLTEENEIYDQSSILKSYFNQSNNMVTVDIKGNNVTDIGQIINLNFPKVKPMDTGNLKDLLVSGRYLVIGKRHQFNRNDNLITLDCIRDSNNIDSNYSGNKIDNSELGGEDV